MTTQTKDDGSAWPSSNPGFPPDAEVETGRRVRIAFVEDDDDFREAASGELGDHGFDVAAFRDGTGLVEFLETAGDIEIVVLDWSLPRVSGIDLLPKLQRAGINLPVVFLTGHSEPNYEQLALDRGAIDFVDKSRGVPILARRLRLIVDRADKPMSADGDGNFHCGRLLLKPAVSRAFWDETDLNLTVTEFKIVHALAANIGSYVSYRSVYDCMHYVGFIAGSGENGYRTNVRSCIKRIRNKFRAIDPEFSEIENYQSFGYRWGKE